MTINETVTARQGICIGLTISETVTSGEIVRINEKSIRVHLTHIKRMVNGKVTREGTMNAEVTFTLSKAQNSNGKTIYRNSEYGIIEVHTN